MRNLLVLMLVLALCLAGCSNKCDFKKQQTPALYEATFVESSGTGEMMIKATGIGCSVEEALEEAKKTAVWFVLEGGDKPILKTQAEKTRAYGLEIQMYADPVKYIRWVSDIKSKKKEGGKTKVTYLFKIDVAMIQQELAAAEIITSTEDLGESMGLPTVSVFADKGGDFAKTAVSALQEYFQDNSFEVYKAAQGDTVNKIVAKMAALEGAETDPMHDMALSLGTDVYAKVNYSGSGSKASVAVEVFETATGKMLGTTTGYSAERRVSDANALVQEAVNDASAKVISQIRKEWMKMSKKGKPFKLAVLSNSTDGAAVSDAVYAVLKGLSTKPVKPQAGGKSTFSYIVYLKDIPNAYEFFMALKKAYSGPGQLEKVSDAGSFLVIKAAGNGEVELTIE